MGAISLESPAREYVNTHTGFMAALLALNNEVRDVAPGEA